jgi:hypothetical protein
MPEPRRYRPAAVSVEYDPTDRRTAGSEAARRDIAARAADNYPAGRPSRRRRAGDGYPVQVRNGMPEPVLRPVTDTARCGCVRRLDPAVMDWELVTACGARHE